MMITTSGNYILDLAVLGALIFIHFYVSKVLNLIDPKWCNRFQVIVFLIILFIINPTYVLLRLKILVILYLIFRD